MLNFVLYLFDIRDSIFECCSVSNTVHLKRMRIPNIIHFICLFLFRKDILPVKLKP